MHATVTTAVGISQPRLGVLPLADVLLLPVLVLASMSVTTRSWLSLSTSEGTRKLGAWWDTHLGVGVARCISLTGTLWGGRSKEMRRRGQQLTSSVALRWHR